MLRIMRRQLTGSLRYLNNMVMKTRLAAILILLMQGMDSTALFAQGISATDIVRKADEKFNGEKSSYSVMSMTIIRPGGRGQLNSRTGPLEGILP